MRSIGYASTYEEDTTSEEFDFGETVDAGGRPMPLEAIAKWEGLMNSGIAALASQTTYEDFMTGPCFAFLDAVSSIVPPVAAL